MKIFNFNNIYVYLLSLMETLIEQLFNTDIDTLMRQEKISNVDGGTYYTLCINDDGLCSEYIKKFNELMTKDISNLSNNEYNKIIVSYVKYVTISKSLIGKNNELLLKYNNLETKTFNDVNENYVTLIYNIIKSPQFEFNKYVTLLFKFDEKEVLELFKFYNKCLTNELICECLKDERNAKEFISFLMYDKIRFCLNDEIIEKMLLYSYKYLNNKITKNIIKNIKDFDYGNIVNFLLVLGYFDIYINLVKSNKIQVKPKHLEYLFLHVTTNLMKH